MTEQKTLIDPNRLPISYEEEIRLLLIEGFSKFASEARRRPFGADLSDITKEYELELIKLLSQAVQKAKQEQKSEIATKAKMNGWVTDINTGKKMYLIDLELLTQPKE